jgi:hypothetical protein
MLYTDSNNIYSKCSSDTAPNNDKPVDTTLVNIEPINIEQVNIVPINDKLVDTSLIDTTPFITASSSNNNPVDTVPVDAVPVDSVPVDTLPVDTVPVDTVPVDTVPVDSVPVDTLPVDTVPVDTVPSDTVPSDSDTQSCYTTLINKVQSYPTLFDSASNSTLKFFNFVENSELYVVSVDDSPKFYVNNEKSAFDKMWEVTRLLSSKYVFDGYKTQFIEVKDNELHILGSYRFFIIAYDQILNRITYNKISQCV